ncbi:hypothetical protein [Streptomyces sp. NPDC051569]|uniref:hypothetical protein n=1 Tax=Streptomyces sp. NPDC051569 TaxID=3365661 RepID=UPI0037A52FED
MDAWNPGTLAWTEVDPDRHAFDMNEAEAALLLPLVVALIPPAAAIRGPGWDAMDPVTQLLVDRYGRWACGWNWSVGEGDVDGGVIGSWCCPPHSVTTPENTASLVIEALEEWRAWLEDLSERFAALAPPAAASGDEGDPWPWARACTRLVTVVADRSEAESGWMRHCAQVLEWFLASHGFGESEADAIVGTAIGGRFDSWVTPAIDVVDAVADRFAAEVAGRG